jgi:hypothetical protein
LVLVSETQLDDDDDDDDDCRLLLQVFGATAA